MRDLWKLMDKLIESNYMVRFNVWPSKTIAMSVNKLTNEHEQFLYEASSLDEMEAQVMKDFGHLIESSPRTIMIKELPFRTIASLAKSPLLPPLPGLPKR